MRQAYESLLSFDHRSSMNGALHFGHGMDALAVQVAKEYKAALITFDMEMEQKAAEV